MKVKSRVSYTLVVYMKDGDHEYTVREKVPGERLDVIKAVAEAYAKEGLEYLIYKEEVTPVKFMLSNERKVEL